MKEFAKGVLGQALQEEELCVEDVRRELFVRNRRGLSLAGLPARVDALAGEVSAHRTNVASLNGGHLTQDRDRLSRVLCNRSHVFVRGLQAPAQSFIERSKQVSWLAQLRQTGGPSQTTTDGLTEAMPSSMPSCIKAWPFMVCEKHDGMGPSIVLRISV